MEIQKYKEPKTYVVILKNKEREHLYMTTKQGEAIEKWWREGRPSEKVAIHDEYGNYQETLQNSEISWIGKKKFTQSERDKEGRIGEKGFICEWGEWHYLNVIKQDNCGCFEKYKSHHIEMRRWISENYPEKIHTSKQYTQQMKKSYLKFKNNG